METRFIYIPPFLVSMHPGTLIQPQHLFLDHHKHQLQNKKHSVTKSYTCHKPGINHVCITSTGADKMPI